MDVPAKQAHPPPRRGLGGGSNLELPAKQAGVEVVSRGNRLIFLTRALDEINSRD